MTLGVTQDVLDRWVARSPHGGGCTLPGCGCEPRRGSGFRQACHPEAGWRVHALASGTIILNCRRCPNAIQHIAVTDALSSGPVRATCHPRGALRVSYLVGGDLVIRCHRCLATVVRLTVATRPRWWARPAPGAAGDPEAEP